MRLIQAGQADQSIIVRALTSAGATATPAYNDSGIAATYKRDATGPATTITLATQTSTGAHVDGGFVHIGGGDCRLDLPDAAVADGATRVTVTINATAWVGFTEEILLVDYDPTGPVNANVTAMASGVITNTAIAADAIGASELAADAVAEIQSGLATSSALTTAQADLTTLTGRLTSARAGYLDNLSAGAVALASALTTAQADLTTLVGRITGAVSLATATTAAAIRSALGMAAATMDTNIPGVLQTKAEADTAHGLLATAANLATLTGYVDTEVAAIKAKTDNLPSDPADQSQVDAAITAAQGALSVLIGALNDIAAADVWTALDDTAANKLADHVLRRAWASAAVSADGDALAFRSLLGATAKLVNRVGISGATLTVYEDDDLTALGTQALTSDADAEPITGQNTV